MKLRDTALVAFLSPHIEYGETIVCLRCRRVYDSLDVAPAICECGVRLTPPERDGDFSARPVCLNCADRLRTSGDPAHDDCVIRVRRNDLAVSPVLAQFVARAAHFGWSARGPRAFEQTIRNPDGTLSVQRGFRLSFFSEHDGIRRLAVTGETMAALDHALVSEFDPAVQRWVVEETAAVDDLTAQIRRLMGLRDRAAERVTRATGGVAEGASRDSQESHEVR